MYYDNRMFFTCHKLLNTFVLSIMHLLFGYLMNAVPIIGILLGMICSHFQTGDYNSSNLNNMPLGKHNR